MASVTYTVTVTVTLSYTDRHPHAIRDASATATARASCDSDDPLMMTRIRAGGLPSFLSLAAATAVLGIPTRVPGYPGYADPRVPGYRAVSNADNTVTCQSRCQQCQHCNHPGSCER
eukprot:3496655-Rhodomonas_salina.1